ncbi:MAG: sodium:proton antiporter [Pseudomonadota bacterium]
MATTTSEQVAGAALTEPVLLFALIGVLGIGSQWLAWRLRMPAIVLMLAAGLIAGPVTGLIDPEASLQDLFRPIISIAVAVILFEGGITLDFRSLRDAGPAVKRLVLVCAPLGWLLSALAIRYGAGLSWESAAVFGGILVVTGPTVVQPLLRQARLAPRPASVLRWEAIVNDPVGALAAVLAFEVITAIYGASTLALAAQHLAVGIFVASLVGYAAGYFLATAFRRAWVPEYMKVPVLFGAVLAVYASTDSVLHESGLLAVTIMGIYIANAHLPSLEELKRFKEHVTVILVSGVFILLAASLKWEMVALLDWRAIVFVALIILFARPVTVWISLLGTKLTWQEKAMVAWIGPRGVVAVAVAGLFGTRLSELGVPDGAVLAPLAFALVAATVVVHGFSMGPLARALNLTTTEPPGLLIVGGSNWSVDLATDLQEAGVPVLIGDRNWFRLRAARTAGVPVFYGEILSEAAEHTVDLNRYGMILAATDNDAYNALICTEFGPEFGRNNVYQLGRHAAGEDERGLPVTIGGRSFAQGATYDFFVSQAAKGWEFTQTKISEEYPLDTYLAARDGVVLVGVLGPTGLRPILGEGEPKLGKDDRLLAFAPPQEAGKKARATT